MIRDIDDKPLEPARKKAQRRWRNHSVEKSFKEERKKAESTPKAPKELELADVIQREKPDGRGSVTRAQTKFIKDLKAMLNEHTERNKKLYLISIYIRKKRLLMEKLRRLKLREAEREAEQLAQQKPKSRDLFA
jgi:hypothetical protein